MASKMSLACRQFIVKKATPPSHTKVWRPKSATSFPPNQCSDSMAPLSGSRRLICFYCGRKSPGRQDGSVREWECRNCEAVNYLDENGEITDPPVAIVEDVPDKVQYARQSESPSSTDPDNGLFCNDCLKNQHLVRSSLAQYVPEEQDTLAVDRNYLKFKESLEKRYPQVCEDCLPRVIDRLKQTSYTAKTDHLRRLLDKTRQKFAPAKSGHSWLDIVDILGQICYFVGILGQLLCSSAGISVYLIRHLLNTWNLDFLQSEPLIDPDSDVVLSSLASWIQAASDVLVTNGSSVWSSGYYGINTGSLARWGLLLSLISLWWNPKFKEGYRGYHRHIKGFQDWYKYQALLFVARVIFCSIMKYEFLDGIGLSANIGAHTFMLGFTLSVTIAAHRCFKIDFGQLFAPTSPERLLPYVGRKQKSKYDGNDMSIALTSILEESSPLVPISSDRRADPFYTSAQTSSASRYMGGTRHDSESTALQHRSPPRDPRNILGVRRTVPSLAEMTSDESFQYLSTGEIPTRFQDEMEYDDAQDVMEWRPQSSQHRAFQPAQAPRQSQLFGQAPVAPDQSPFWYRGLPPAPVSQAHKARNPQNVPRLQARSLEAKQNFFDHITGRKINSLLQETSSSILETEYPSITPRREVEFAQQKFFPPANPDAADGLSEMFGQAFTLKSNEGDDDEATNKIIVTPSTERRRHFFTALLLLVAFLGWNYSLTHLKVDALQMIPMGVMIACGLIALRSVADFTINLRKNNISGLIAAGAILAGAQTIASGYAMSEIVAGRTYCTTCRLQGSLLIGVMLIQEVCLATFS